MPSQNGSVPYGSAGQRLSDAPVCLGQAAAEAPRPDRLMVQSQAAWRDVRGCNPYLFIESTYFGDRGYRDGYFLIPHPREAYYETRRASSYYNNVFKPVLNAMVDDVFSSDIRRPCDNAAFAAFLGNCDNCGTPLQNLVEDAMHFGRMHDVVFLVMDNFRKEQQPATAAEAVNNRVIPYVYLKKAWEVYEWQTDTFGRLTSIDFIDDVREEIVDAGGSRQVRQFQTYRHWDAERWQVYRLGEDAAGPARIVLEEGPVSIDRLPVIAMLDFARTDNLKKMPEPSSYDLAFLCFALFNKESEYRYQEQMQGFSIYYAQGFDSQSMTVGPSNLWILPPDAKIPPGVLSSNPEFLNLARESCQRLEETIRRNAQQKGVIGVAQSASGVSKQWDFRGEEKILRRTSLAARNLEIAIAKMFQLYTGEAFDYLPDYPTSFSPQRTHEAVDGAVKLLQQSPPAPMRKELWKMVAIELFGPDEVSGKTIVAELEDDAVYAPATGRDGS